MLSARNRFQYQVATGRLTLPVAVILTLAAWAFSSVHDWLNIGSLLAFGVTAYLLLETETKFALIRTRRLYPACLVHRYAAEPLPELRILLRAGQFVSKLPVLKFRQLSSSAFGVDSTFIIYTRHQPALAQYTQFLCRHSVRLFYMDRQSDRHLSLSDTSDKVSTD